VKELLSGEPVGNFSIFKKPGENSGLLYRLIVIKIGNQLNLQCSFELLKT